MRPFRPSDRAYPEDAGKLAADRQGHRFDGGREGCIGQRPETPALEQAAGEEEAEQRHPETGIAERPQGEEQRQIDRQRASIRLRMSRVHVAPMKTPSNSKAMAPQSGVSAAKGRKARAASRTAGLVLTRRR